MIEYQITPLLPTAHIFEVICRIDKPDSAGQQVTLPAWIPGSYLVRDFARHITTIEASDAKGDLDVQKIDKQTWKCAAAMAAIEIRIEVYAFDESVRAAYLNESRGFFNGTSVFLRVVGQEQQACSIKIMPPTDEQFADWRVATTLPSVDISEEGFGQYRADNYADLIDYPVEMGVFDCFEFEAGGVPHAMALCGTHDADTVRVSQDLKKICEVQQDMFGGSPLERYLFLTLVKTQGFGGLEHRNSTSLICSRSDLPTREMVSASQEYHRFLALCSHEYFHLWNVKRIRPPAVSGSDLTAEAYFHDLWAYEGITSYYDELFLLRAGVIEPQAYLDELARTITRVWRTPGRHKQSLSESSFDAWTKFYKQDENAPNAIVSYYAKGAVVAMCLDLQLRLDSEGAKSLDDVMRLLWQRYGAQNNPVPEHGIEALVEEVAGLSYSEFFAAYIYGKEDPPVAELLTAFGIKVRLRQRNGAADLGGVSNGPVTGNADLGVLTAVENGREIVKVVLNGRAGEEAGIQVGDEIVSINGQRLIPGSIDSRLNLASAGDCWVLHVFRDDMLIDKDVLLGEKPLDTWSLSLPARPEPEQLAMQQSWWQK